jgi:hypothetical protein
LYAGAVLAPAAATVPARVTAVATAALALAACGGRTRPARPASAAPPAAAAPTLLVTLATDPLAPLALAADRDHLLWTSRAGIVIAGADGGSPRTLVPEVFVTWMRVRGDQLLYRVDGGGAADTLYTVALAGGAPRPLPASDPARAAAGGGEAPPALAATGDTGDVFTPTDGSVLVVGEAGDDAPAVYLPPATGHRWIEDTAIALPDRVLAASLGPDDAVGLWRLPRGAAGGPRLLDLGVAAAQLVASGGHAYHVDVPVGVGGGGSTGLELPPNRLLRVGASEKRTVVATAGFVEAIAARGDAVAYAAAGVGDGGPAVWLVDGGGPPRKVAERRGGPLVGLALAETALYWIEDGAIWTAPRRGGQPQRFHQPSWSGGQGAGRVQLVIDGGSVYFSSLGLGAAGVFRTRGGADESELWAAPAEGLGDELLQVGGALFVVAGRRAIWRVPMDGSARRPIFELGADAGELIGAAAGGGRVHALVAGADGTEAVALDPTTGAPGARLPVGKDVTAIAADDTALYVVSGELGWLIAIPHPPPP